MYMHSRFVGFMLATVLLAGCTNQPAVGQQPTTVPQSTAVSTPQPTGTGTPRPAGSPTAFVAKPLTPAPAPRGAGTTGFGRTATQDVIAKIDIDVRADGKGLPQGGGTPAEGAPIFTARCASCHGANGEGSTIGPKLVDANKFEIGKVTASIGNYWPYAPTVWDYINRAMPFDKPNTLTVNEVYAVTAWLLAQNKVIGENQRMDQTTLPAVQMPNRNSFTSPDPRPDTP